MRQRGHVVCVDTEGIIVGVFRQHTSRKLDPQLHTHAVIANRVRAPDGRWLALDARTLKMDQRTLSGLYHAGLRAELTRRLGVRWEPPVNGISEIIGIHPDVLAEFSQRTADIEQRVKREADPIPSTTSTESPQRRSGGSWNVRRWWTVALRSPTATPPASSTTNGGNGSGRWVLNPKRWSPTPPIASFGRRGSTAARWRS